MSKKQYEQRTDIDLKNFRRKIRETYTYAQPIPTSVG